MNLTRLETIPVVQAVGIRALKVHQFVYERSGGRIGHRLAGTRNLLLRTVGARTGQPRTNALSYARDGDAYVIVASMGGAPRSPGWYHNLRADPVAEIQVGTRRMRVRAGSSGSPAAARSCTIDPVPIPASTRPPERTSMVAYS